MRAFAIGITLPPYNQSIIAIALLTLLIVRELVIASHANRVKWVIRILNIAILPLLLAFAYTVATKLAQAL